MLYSLTVMAKQKRSHDHHPPRSHFDALTEQRLKECERLISRMKKAKKSDQENEEDDSYGSKIEQRVIQRDSGPKGGNLSRNKRKSTTSHILFFPISFCT